jgi:hypothetical protein
MLRGSRVCVVDFLRHGAHQAGELWQFALEQRLSKIDVSKHAFQRVGGRVIRRGGEKSRSNLAPVVGGSNCQIFLGAEVVKEAPLGEPGRFADVLDAGSRIALGADHGERRLQKAGLRFVSGFGGMHRSRVR